MKLEVLKENEVTILQIRGSLDVSHQSNLKDQLYQVVDNGGNDIVFDFQAVNFIDSSCLGVLVALTKKLRGKNGDIKLTNLSEDVKSIFQITRLDKIFEVFENNQEAVNSFFR